MDYDTIEPRNKMLDMTGNSSWGQEELKIFDAETTSADINVYFVYEFNYTINNKVVIGKAVQPRVAYVDVKKSTASGSDLRQVAAHEIGHDLGIAVHADQAFSSSPLHVAMDPKKRLMNSFIVTGSDTVLIKAEWDLINDDNLP